MEKAFLNISKIGFFGGFLLLLSACAGEDVPECFQTSGKMIEKELPVSYFEEVIVYGGIKLFVQQGPAQKLVVSTGKNLLDEISAEVEAERLILKNDQDCNLFRDYEQTEIYLTVPNLTFIQNAGNQKIESIGNLYFPELLLKSTGDHDGSGATTGDFELQLVSEKVKVLGDDFSNFFLSGVTQDLEIRILLGDGRVEAGDLVAQRVQLFHRGTNKLIVNPQQVLSGEIRSTGDVISVNRPPVVDVQSFYTGKLIFR